jgi:hypothetical protein
MYRNNLQKNDRVFHVPTKRQAKVDKDPRETSRMVSIVFDGIHTPKYVDIREVRLMPDGRTPENVPPCDGDPNEDGGVGLATTPKIRVQGTATPMGLLESAKGERARNATEMQVLETRFKHLKAANEKLDRAIAVLTAP